MKVVVPGSGKKKIVKRPGCGGGVVIIRRHQGVHPLGKSS